MKKIDINELLKNNLISEQEFNNIKNFYENNDKNDTKSKTTLFLNILAGVLLALGIIWVIAANWNNISGNVKIIVGMTLLLLSFSWTIYSKIKGKNLELQSLVFLGLAIGNVALISQTYHIMGDMRTFLLVVLAMLASIPFYTNSKVLTFLFFICSNIYILMYDNLFVEITRTSYHNYDLKFLLLFLLSVVIVAVINILHISFNKGKIFDLKLLIKDDNRRMLSLQIVSLIILSIFMSSMLDVLTMTFLIIMALGYFITKKLGLLTQKRLYLGVLIILTYAFTYGEYMNYNNYTGLGFAITILYSVLALALVGYYFIKRFKKDNSKIELFVSIALILHLLQYITHIEIMFVWALYIFIFAVQQMYFGINKRLIKYFNFGEAMFIILIFRYLFEGDMSILARGIICIVIAIIILLVNNYLNRNILKKENSVREEVK